MDQCFCKHRVGQIIEDNDDYCISALPCVCEDKSFEGMIIDIQDKTDGYSVSLAPKYCPFCGEKIREEWQFDFG